MTSPSIILDREKANSSSSVRIPSVGHRPHKSDNSENSSRISSRSNNNNNNNNNNCNNNNNNNLHKNNTSSINDPNRRITSGQIVRTAGSAVIMCGQRNIDLLRRRQPDEDQRLIVVNENKLYDLTDFAQFHPGGSEILREHRGRDIGEVMRSDQFHRHSRTAFTILDKYYVGNYCDATGPNDGDDLSGEQWTREGQGEGDEEKQKSEYHFNWKKPILGQLDQLGDSYFEWVHQPEEHHIRLFQSDFCEYFSKSPWWLVPLIWVPITCLAFYYSYQNIQTQTEMLHFPFAQNGVEINAYHLPVIYLVGMLQWTLLEYVIHRWLFHLKPIHSSPMFVRFHFLLHGQHHKAPMDKSRLVFPPIPAFVFALSIYKLLRSVFPVAVTQSLFAGTVLGYLIYDLIHYYLHHGSPAFHYFKELKHYHMLHHYVNQHSGFGISSKLWDYPFGTLISTRPHN